MEAGTNHIYILDPNLMDSNVHITFLGHLWWDHKILRAPTFVQGVWCPPGVSRHRGVHRLRMHVLIRKVIKGHTEPMSYTQCWHILLMLENDRHHRNVSIHK